MRITQESDYALRIVAALALSGGIADAKALATATSVTSGFTVKILRKLTLGGIVAARKGANGGYYLLIPPENLTMKDVIETIEGPIVIARCVHSDGTCSQGGVNRADCRFRQIFRRVGEEVAASFSSVRIADVIASGRQCEHDHTDNKSNGDLIQTPDEGLSWLRRK